MSCIKIIKDEDFNLISIPFNNPKHRYASRGIILNNVGKIALLNKQVKHEYKLIGGGIKYGETPQEAFKREALEETGCKILITEELGTIEEEKSLDNFKQTSYVFVGKVVNDTKQMNLSKKETDEKARIIWVNIKEAYDLIKKSEKSVSASKYENLYHSKFIVRRDFEILKYYLNLHSNM